MTQISNYNTGSRALRNRVQVWACPSATSQPELPSSGPGEPSPSQSSCFGSHPPSSAPPSPPHTHSSWRDPNKIISLLNGMAPRPAQSHNQSPQALRELPRPNSPPPPLLPRHLCLLLAKASVPRYLRLPPHLLQTLLQGPLNSEAP